jgi:ABC-type sugar transport system ATPase subunit
MTDIVLRTEHLTKPFGSLAAVDDLSLEVQAGEIFGFLGPNGAGKTTSISMMCGLLQPDAGRDGGRLAAAGPCGHAGAGSPRREPDRGARRFFPRDEGFLG